MQPSETVHPDKAAFTIEEFAAAYGIRRTKIYEQINTGKLKARRVGGRTLIGKPDADAWFAALPPISLKAAA